MKKLLEKNETYVFLIILFLSMVIQIKSSGLFFTNTNIVFLFRSITVNAIYALCALLAFVSTGTDVSFPMIGALSTYVVFILGAEHESIPAIVLILIAVLIGAICGCVNGFFIVKYKFRSLIVTLAVSVICYGIIFGAFGGSRKGVPGVLKGLSNWTILRVTNSQTGLSAILPGLFLVMVLLYLVVSFVLNHTMIGRGVYAIGGDEVAAARIGYHVDRIRFGIFVANGMIASIGGMTYALMSNNCTPTEYYGGEMIVIAAIVLGGVRLTGGVGSLPGCLLGTFLLTMVTNSLTLVGISVYWQQVFIGAIIAIGATVSAVQTQKSLKTIVREEKKA